MNTPEGIYKVEVRREEKVGDSTKAPGNEDSKVRVWEDRSCWRIESSSVDEKEEEKEKEGGTNSKQKVCIVPAADILCGLVQGGPVGFL